MVTAPLRLQRIAAYAVCTDAFGRVLLVRASRLSHFPGRWFLPGGGVDHGEHPEGALRREVLEETALDVRVASLRTVLSDVTTLPDDGSLLHTVRFVYDVEILGGALQSERDGTTDAVRWCHPDESSALPLMPFVSIVLSSPSTSTGGVHHVELYVADLDRSAGFWRPLLESLGWSAYQSWPGGRSWRLGATYLVFVQVADDLQGGLAVAVRTETRVAATVQDHAPVGVLDRVDDDAHRHGTRGERAQHAREPGADPEYLAAAST